MLRQIEWRLQNGPITKSGVLSVTALVFWKICSSSRTLMYQQPKFPYSYFSQARSLTLGCFFPVSILKKDLIKIGILLDCSLEMNWAIEEYC